MRRNKAHWSAVLVAASLGLITMAGAQETGSGTGATKPKLSPQQTYIDMRRMMIEGPRSKFGLPPTSSPTGPWGVVMDQGFEKGVITTVAMSDGSASLYFSNGGGFIGGKGQEPIKNAAQAAVRVAQDFTALMKPTNEYPVAGNGEVTLYLMTDSGVLTAKAELADVKNGLGQFAPLWRAMENVAVEYRRWDQGGRKGGGGTLTPPK